MTRSQRRSRLFRIGFAFLLVVSAAQVAWWMLDQWRFSAEVEARLLTLHQGRVEAAGRLLAAGIPVDRIRTDFPEVAIRDGQVSLAPELARDLRVARERRINRYLWEGAFFLLVLGIALGVIGSALRLERQLRRRQENFLAAVSHELKSPLAAASVAADTLQLRAPPSDPVRPEVRRIRRNLARLEAMIGNLLHTARLDSGELVLEPQDVDLANALRPVVEAYRERATESGVELQTQLEPGIAVRVDVAGLRAVLRNLLENAYKAVEHSDAAWVRIAASRSQDRIRLAVEDNGHGFEPDLGPRLFEKFYRPGDELRRGGRGAGLGLHLVGEIVSLSGGAAEAVSDGIGRGACVSVTLPASSSR